MLVEKSFGYPMVLSLCLQAFVYSFIFPNAYEGSDMRFFSGILTIVFAITNYWWFKKEENDILWFKIYFFGFIGIIGICVLIANY